MRVTNSMLSKDFLNDMQLNLDNLKTLQGQLTSGKEIKRPSDDPFKASRSMQIHTDINTNKQYNTNIKNTKNWLDETDTSLKQLGDQFQRVRELLVSCGNPGYGMDERQKVKDEINEIVGQISQTLNSSFDGKYLFGGTRTTAKPTMISKDAKGNSILQFSSREGKPLKKGDVDSNNKNEYNMINDNLVTEISQGVYVGYNVKATDVMNFEDGDGNAKDLGEILKKIVDDIDNTDPKASVEEITKKDLKEIDDVMNNILKLRSGVGAKQNRMKSAEQKNEAENFDMTEILSKTEDINFTEKIMQMAVSLTVYMASLQTSAKVIQPSLMDYLR